MYVQTAPVCLIDAHFDHMNNPLNSEDRGWKRFSVLVPLITAAIHNEWEVGVRFLLRVGAKLALDDFSTQNPLVAACQVCSPKMALLVWEAWLPSQPSAALRERVHELALRCLESSWQFSMEEANAILEGIGAKLRFQP